MIGQIELAFLERMVYSDRVVCGLEEEITWAAGREYEG
jgi:hypothetical protein